MRIYSSNSTTVLAQAVLSGLGKVLEILVLSKFEFVFVATVEFSIIRDIESTVCIVAVYFLS